jgi:hypothetical protein
MCKAGKQLIFCTCSEKKTSTTEAISTTAETEGNVKEYFKTGFMWELKRTVRKRMSNERTIIMGTLTLPIQRLDEELHAQYVVDQLNSEAFFDFEYTPTDGDELCIRQTYTQSMLAQDPRPNLYFQFMKFVYEHGEWYFGYVNHFQYVKQNLSSGSIKIRETKDV